MPRPPIPEPDNEWKIAPTEVPTLVHDIGPVAEKEYRRISPFLEALDRVAAIDRQALVVYCTQWATFSNLMESDLASESSYLSCEGRNSEIPNPLLAPLIRSGMAVIRTAGSFGMTARTRDLESDHGNRKSSTLKKLMGNQRKVAESKVGPKTIIPMVVDWTEQDVAPPTWMSPRASQEYRDLGEELEKLDLFTPLDVTPLVISCCYYDLYLRAGEQMVLPTVPVTNKEGAVVYEKENPLLKIQTDLFESMRAIWKDYGQTPRCRKVFNGERKKEGREVPLVFTGRGVG